MGYISTVHGEWTIHPPLNGREVRAIPDVECVQVRVEATDLEIEDGIVTVIQGVAIEPAIDEGKVYELHDDLKQVLKAIPKDREVRGEIVRVGEENGDVERYVPAADKTRVHSEQAQLRWPDGTEVRY